MPTQKTLLIEKGILKSFLVDRVGALKTGYERTGSGRRQNYRFPPASRMRNTFIEKGKNSLNEMVASIDHGIYAKVLGGGSVSPGTGEFNFAVQEGYLIEKGKIGRAVKGATLIGSGPAILKRISMVGSDLELSAGMCGSVSGSVPVTVGQPSLKVDKILVGGSGHHE
jgi:TldD protein